MKHKNYKNQKQVEVTSYKLDAYKQPHFSVHLNIDPLKDIKYCGKVLMSI